MSIEAHSVSPVVLCGGSGTRLWPMSRTSFPKQFLQLHGVNSLFQQTLIRLSENLIYSPPIIVTGEDHRFHVAEQARQIGVELEAILIEPMAKNTAPAIGAAAAYVYRQKEYGILHVLPSDHLIVDDENYRASLVQSVETAASNYLVTFGIQPKWPATGFGYIELGEELSTGANSIARFVEKPDKEAAENMLVQESYLWNSGMFVFRADSFLEELKAADDTTFHSVMDAVKNAVEDLDFARLDAEAFGKCTSISVDYAVFERTKKAAVVKSAIEWSDIGSWQSLWEAQEKDGAGNSVKGDATLIDAHNNLIMSDQQHVVVNGISDAIIVATNDALLISAADRSEQIKDIVGMLNNNPETRPLTEEHKTVYRPWGGYTSILNGENFQVKRLFILPGKKLSLQRHKYRSEHWVVVGGKAKITIDDEIKILNVDQSVYIPLGAIHRLENEEEVLLEVIEVQTGSYLGEDDIERFQDEFGRT